MPDYGQRIYPIAFPHRTLNADTIKAVMNGIYAKFGFKENRQGF